MSTTSENTDVIPFRISSNNSLSTGNFSMENSEIQSYDDESEHNINDSYLLIDEDEDENTAIQKKLTIQMSNISLLSQIRRNEIERSITHYEDMEKGINRLPQFYKADEFLKCLSQFTVEKESLKDMSKLFDQRDLNQDFIRYEVIIENQRGATLFGSKLYSKESVLYPLDPPKYQTLTGQNLTHLSMYPEPANNWHWSWEQWHVMMINDVDEEGWIYSAVRFGSYHWAGVGKFGNFVRRRIWVRLAERSKTEDDIGTEYQKEPEDETSELGHVITVCSNYHEREELKEGQFNKDKHKFAEVKFFVANILNKNTREKTKKISESTKRQQSHKTNFAFKNHTYHHKEKKPVHTIEDVNCLSSAEGEWAPTDSRLADNLPIIYSGDPRDADTHANIPVESKDNFKVIELAYSAVSAELLDRGKISVILDYFFTFKIATLTVLIEDYVSNSDKSKSWIYKYIGQIHFHDSKNIFVSKFKTKLNELGLAPEYNLLERIYLICDEIVRDASYNSERYIK
jgi:hypothetical protein